MGGEASTTPLLPANQKFLASHFVPSSDGYGVSVLNFRVVEFFVCGYRNGLASVDFSASFFGCLGFCGGVFLCLLLLSIMNHEHWFCAALHNELV
jgi:hypothetical protein